MKANKQNENFLQPEVIHVKTPEEFDSIIHDRVRICKTAIPFAKFLIEEGEKYPDIEEMIMLEVVLDDYKDEMDGPIKAAVALRVDTMPKFFELSIKGLIALEEFELCCVLRDLQAKLVKK